MAEETSAKTHWPAFRSLASYRPSDLPGELIAGLTLAAIAIPEQMATARLGGFPPQIGFFAFIAGSLGFAAFGSNRFLSCGADSTITPIFAGGLVLMAASGSRDYQPNAMAVARLVRLSFLIAIVVMVQTAATTRSFPSDPDQPADVDRDFLGAGAGSVLAGLFGAFPVNASPPRTGIVCETGGRSQLSGLFAAGIVLALLAFGATLLQHVPNAALGGVLLFVALRIIRVNQIVAVYRQSIGEFFLIVATAAAIIVLPIEQGVAVGIALSLLHGIWTTTRARLVPFDRVPDTTIWWPANPKAPGERNPDIAVVGLQAPLSFLNAQNFRADILNVAKNSTPKPRLLVIEASGILE